MSRIGNLPIVIPGGVDVTPGNGTVTVKGPKGQLSQTLLAGIGVKIEDGRVVVSREKNTKEHRAYHGLFRALINNMVKGVSEGYSIELQLIGTGYRASMQGNGIKLQLGFSHDVVYPLPDGIKAEVADQTKITLTGIDKQQLGQVAAEIKRIRPVEPYKGKGVRYANEQVRRKEGKSGKK